MRTEKMTTLRQSEIVLRWSSSSCAYPSGCSKCQRVLDGGQTPHAHLEAFPASRIRIPRAPCDVRDGHRRPEDDKRGEQVERRVDKAGQ